MSLSGLARRFPPEGLVFVSILSVQTGAALATRLFAALGPAGTAFGRVACAALILGLLIRPRLAGKARETMAAVLPLGMAIAGMNLCVYEALARIPLGIAVAIEFLGPLGIAVTASRRARDFLWIGLAVLGLALLTPDLGGALAPLGVVFALLAAGGWAGFVLASRRAGRLIEGQAGIALAMAVAALLLSPFAVPDLSAAHFSPAVLAAVVGIAVLSSAVPMSCEYAALRQVSPYVYSILVTTEPAVAAILGALMLHQALSVRAIGAIAAVTLATLGVTVFDK